MYLYFAFFSTDVLVNNSPWVLNQSFKCLIDGEKLNLHLIFLIGGVEKHHEFSVLELNSVLYIVDNLQFNRYYLTTACYCHRQHAGKGSLGYNPRGACGFPRLLQTLVSIKAKIHSIFLFFCLRQGLTK